MTTKKIIGVGLTVIVLASAIYFVWSGEVNKTDTQAPPETGERITYTCADDRSFEVLFGKGESEGIVAVILEGDMAYTLEQTIAASGVRYANDNEDFVFWTKGNTAFIEQMGEPTYQGCGEGSQLVE